jgi:ribosomal RNA assembly protein
MQTIHFKNTAEIRRALSILEKKLKIKISIKGKSVSFEGTALNEYEASLVLDAINLGFSSKKALQLTDEDYIFRRIFIKDFSNKKNLKEVKARIIGTKGRTKKTIENISNCDIVIHNNEIGIIGSAESIEDLITAITSLIRGTKQSNTYKYLEKINKNRKQLTPRI